MDGKVMEMVFRVPGKNRPRIMRVEGCQRPLDGFSAILNKYPNAEFVSFDGHLYKTKA